MYEEHKPWVAKIYQQMTGNEVDIDAFVQAEQAVMERMVDEPGTHGRTPVMDRSDYHVYDAHNQLWQWDKFNEKWNLVGSNACKTWVDLCMEQGPVTVYAKISVTRRGW